MSSQEVQLRKIIQLIVTSHQEDQLDCESCSMQLDCLAEQVAQGANLHDLLPAVERHLECCQDCNEEFQALLCILRAEFNGYLVPPDRS
jgi:hypothetical protein